MRLLVRLGLVAVLGVGLVEAGPRIAAGGGAAFTAYIDDSGAVWRWGHNFVTPSGPFSQLTPDSDTHARRVDDLAGSVALAAGDRHLLALRADGTVWGIGSNGAGQLGDGTTEFRAWAAPVSGLTGVAGIAAQGGRSLAVKSDGTVWGWGYSGGAQFTGVWVSGPITTPVQIAGLADVKQVAAGTDFWMALKGDGTVWVWGSNQHGQYGDGTIGLTRPGPGPVPELTGVKAVAAGQNFCVALLHDGTVRAWGHNTSGQLGDGTIEPRLTPVIVSGLNNIGALAVGHNGQHALALKSDGTVWGWGTNSSGQLGDGTRVWRPAAVQVEGLTGVAELATGRTHSLALLNDGALRAWGANLANELHTGGLIFQPIPARVASEAPYLEIAAGANHSLARRAGGEVWSWGTNREGQLGDGTLAARAIPDLATSLSGATGIAAGSTRSIMARGDGTVWETTTTGATAQVNGLAGVTAVSMRGAHKVALLTDGTVRTWDYPGTFFVIPAGPEWVSTVPGLTGITHIAAGVQHAFALRNDGTLWAWGSAHQGQLGTGSAGNFVSSPEQVVRLTNVTSFSAGNQHSLAVTADGKVWAWGYGLMGQLGQPGLLNSAIIPIEVAAVTGAVAVAAGADFSLALRSDGTVWSWGSGIYGTLGRGQSIDTVIPAPVAGLRNIVAISAGESHALALDENGAVWAWGSGMEGQLGGGELSLRTRPTPVAVLGGGDLALSVVTIGPLTVGSTTIFRITGQNVGMDPLTGVTTVRVDLPDGFTYQSAAGTGWTCGASGTLVTCTHAGPMAPGAEIVMELRATLGTAAYPAFTLAATAENPSDLNPNNNTSGTSFPTYLPTTLTPIPNNAISGEGTGRVFTFEFTAPGGAEDLGVVNMLLNSALDGRRACYLAYVRQSNLLYLVADNGGTLLGPLMMNGTGQIANSQCTISGENTTATVVGPYLRLQVNISFNPAFHGHRIWYLAARDRVGGNSGWVPAGIWTVTPLPPITSPGFLSVDPRRTQSPTVLLRSRFYYANGAGNLNVINLLLNNALDGRQACYLAYVVPANILYLVNDAGTALLPGIPADGTGTLSNGQCTIENPLAQTFSSTLWLDMRVTPTPGFAGHRLWYVAARDRLGGNTGWIPAGSWTVEP